MCNVYLALHLCNVNNDAMSKAKQNRNALINQDFSAISMQKMKSPEGLRLMDVYAEIGEKYFISGMQVRRIVRGY